MRTKKNECILLHVYIYVEFLFHFNFLFIFSRFFFALTGLIYYHVKVKHFVVVDVLLKISTI